MDSAIVSVGTSNPQYKIDQQKAADLVAKTLNTTPHEKKIINAIYRFTGIKYRYSVLSDACKVPGEFEFFPNDPNTPFPSTASRLKIYKDNALKLALEAIEECLSNLDGFDRKKITHVITVSCTGMYAPGLDIEIVQALDLDTSTKRTAINFMGCYGAFNGIKVADAICRSEPDASVLVVCVEICTIHFQQKTDLDNLTSNAIFADGASCVLIQGKPITTKYLQLNAFHSDLLPQSNQEMAWHIGDSGFDMVLTSYVPEIIASGIGHFLEKLIAKLEIAVSNIHYFAIHPGAKKILAACEKALGIDPQLTRYSHQTLQNYGNMSSATILFVLKLIWQELGRSDNTKRIFSCAFGPGLTLESMMLQVNCT